MDLREKPGKVQKILELLLRLRLIFVLLLAFVAVFFTATHWQEMVSLPVAASESLGMWLADHSGLGALWQGSQYLAVAAVALVVLLFVFGGVRGGVSGLLGMAAFVFALLVLGGAESMVLVFLGVFAFVGLVLLLFAKIGVACILFPFACCWILWTGVMTVFPQPLPPYTVWAAFSALGFALALAFSLVSSKMLADGTPQAGSLIRSGKKMLLPAAVSSLLVVSALFVDGGSLTGIRVVQAVGVWISFVLWFYLFIIPVSSFAPWERLRSKERKVKLKEKKKK